jgi:Fe-S-cluster containining protein
LAHQQSRPLTCPLLDQTTNACLVYAQRPVACRTYGFYVQRELGLYCRDIESLVADGALADVVWGNHDAIDRRLAGLGQARALTEWFGDWAIVSVSLRPPAPPAQSA